MTKKNAHLLQNLFITEIKIKNKTFVTDEKKHHLLQNLLTTEKKQKQNKRFVIDKKKMPFITEPFYHGEKKR